MTTSSVFRFGPLDRWLHDPDVSEVMVNAGRHVWIERADVRAGGTQYVGELDPGALDAVIERMLAPVGRRLDRANPVVDARLPDGSRMCAVLAPVAVDGTCLSVRRFAGAVRTIAHFAPAALQPLLAEAVHRRCNVLVSGATSPLVIPPCYGISCDRMSTRRAVIYARLSVSSEESVSIERQIEACEKYAEAKGWKVVGIFKDDGVSASTNTPEDRVGWNELLASPQKYDTILVWKLDRFVRRIRDFWRSYERLEEDGRSLASVTESLDMNSTAGQMVASILAGSTQMEAEAISARVVAAQTKLLLSGRVVGGVVPYGYRTIPNPNGPGFVLAQDPDRIGYVRGMVERVQRGNSIYSVSQWLNDEGVPTGKVVRAYRQAMVERGKRGEPECSLRQWLGEDSPGTWAYNTVEGIIRNPILAGMVPFNRGAPKPKPDKTKKSDKTKRRGPEFVRDGGLPKTDESLAIMSAADRRAMLARLDAKDTGHSKPRALRTETSALLSGLVWCGDERHGNDGVRMHRCAEGTTRHGYTCPKCFQTITSFEDVVIKEFLRQKGERVRWTRVEHVVEGGAALLPEIEHRLDELEQLIRKATDRKRRQELQEQQSDLLDLRDAKREEAPNVSIRYDDAGWFGDAWEAAGEDVEERRAVLDDAMKRIWVRRGGTGRRTEAQVLARLTFDWKIPEDLGPVAHD